MVVFVGNLPKTALEKELCQIARLESCAGLRIIRKKARCGDILRYALVPVHNECHARRLIVRLQGLRWNGHCLTARYYEVRVTGNERRRVDWRSLTWEGEERRVTERRTRPSPASRVA